ncbi:DUF938 domain-containing protein [Roseibium denhamense]|uniref:DUF938 domain-containing protein n=1 Tax=Roseibium denhamense TaxID=76305 RepID=A0ABY1PFF7_9HYPH|nr:DUF938 domain-containing protein [Roseibium denhamense]MTI07831.1 DUF938 domain-containing protein [Roseibium denhamense]SMP31795.1 Protein of unknown function [Roseibium denhamense]
MLPFSAAADRNKDVILEKLTPLLAGRRHVLEVGSGNAQHAVHVTSALPHIRWQCSDLAENLPGIAARLADEGNAHTPPALALDVAAGPWVLNAGEAHDDIDVIFTANTLHIMSLDHVAGFFERAGETLTRPGDIMIVYGPLKYGGAFTTESNAAFDLQLKSWNPVSGIRDFEALDAMAGQAGFRFVSDQPMPANNQLVLWERSR